MSNSLYKAVFVAAATLLVTSALADTAVTDSDRARTIAIWGSSVANGAGDEDARGGYAGRLEAMLESRGWEVFNQSRGGDNTISISERFEPGENPETDIRYLTSVDPGYVVIGLSLGNEGLAQCQSPQARRCTRSRDEADAIFEQFAAGLTRLIGRSRAAGITPVVTLPYARSDFSEREYSYTRRMNLLINAWDVPSINMLGAIDDGYGHWANGFWGDPYHPNSAGHTEMYHAIVPSLFAALRAGKAAPEKPATEGFARSKGDAEAPIVFDVKDTLRSFAFTFAFRPFEDGVIAAVGGQTLDHEFLTFRRSYGDFEWDSESSELAPSGKRFVAILKVNDGRLVYTSSDDNAVSGPLGPTDSKWHQVTLTHYVARGETLLYIDGNLAGSVRENLQPESFTLAGPGATMPGAKAARADYRNWMLHRAGLNSDEVAALHEGALLRASLELYAPLAVSSDNLAQSLSEFSVDRSVITFVGSGD